VQLIGGRGVASGADLRKWKTGEGINTRRHLAGVFERHRRKGVHVVTVNDYLARRDSEWMGRLYSFSD
jgi:preprotein translocase subunit SecA